MSFSTVPGDIASPVPSAADWRTIDWSGCRRAAQLGADRVSYVEFGAGSSTVLLVHGLGGNWAVWLESIPSLAESHRVIAVDLPGFGASPLPGEPVSIAAYGRTLLRLIDHLGLDRVTVIGSSLGGWVSAELALGAPGRVERLILVDAAGIVPSPRERRRSLAIMEMAAAMAPLAPRFRRALASRRRLRAMALRYTTAAPGDLAADLVFMALPPAPDPGFRPALKACKRSWSQTWCESLRALRCPTLVIWGGRDSLLPVRHAQEWARLIPGSRLVLMPAAGHLPMLEQPVDFNRLVAEFLGDPPGGEGTQASRVVGADNIG